MIMSDKLTQKKCHIWKDNLMILKNQKIILLKIEIKLLLKQERIKKNDIKQLVYLIFVQRKIILMN